MKIFANGLVYPHLYCLVEERLEVHRLFKTCE